MRLVRIEADRFGGIDTRSLGDLSPALTVVLGPNEAGKSSMTALVRYLLYGFPTPADVREPPHLSPAGKRQGRLVFADGAGEWVLERVEGPHGGPVTVRALSGPSRGTLAVDLTRGVSRAAYRVVFGFGLDEMQQIGQPTGKDDDDLMARLYAAGAGLTVSPPDIRAKLIERAETLWKKGGSVPKVNRARAERAALRAEIKRLEDEADAFRGDAARLAEMEERLATARRDRAETQLRSERLARAAGEVERLLAESAQATARAQELARESAEARRSATMVVVDDAALQVAEAVRGLDAESPGFRERLSALAEQRTRLATAEQHLRASLDAAGWSEAQALAAAGDAGIAADIEAARSELDKLKARAELAAEERDRASADAAGADAGEGTAVASRRAWLLPGAVAAVLGMLGMMAGLVLGQTPLAVFGGVVALAGAVLAYVRMPSARIGSDGAQARSRAATAHAAVSARRALDERTAAWAERVRQWGLGSGTEEPAAVAVRLQAARDARAADRDRETIREAIAREEERIGSYVERVRASVAPLLGEDAEGVTPERCVELPGRAFARVEAAAEADRARTEAFTRADRIDADADAARRAAEASAASATVELAAAGIAGGDLEDVRQLASEARIGAAEALESFDALADETATLRTKVNAESRDDRLAKLRLSEETIGELMAADVREYTVLSLAAQLLRRAQERYELERQPEVLTRAQAAFTLMTNGRYPRISIPLGTNAIEVFTASAAGVAPDKLSRGTAEQLYLALRLGLVDQLGEIGAGLPVLMDDVLVNFSPDRLEPAAAAIADLARRRQVVFFTCHPDMADLLCRVAPGATRIAMDGPAAAPRP